MSPADFRSNSGALAARISGKEQAIECVRRRSRQAEPCRSAEFVSDAEIARFVSVALHDAITALGEPNPENCIRLRAYEARAGMREMMSALPPDRSRDPKVITEYRCAIMFQNVTVDLALNLVASIRRYAKVYERDIPPTS